MDIKNAQFVKNLEGVTNAIKATINSQEWFVPISEDNRHYKAIQEWVADGNTIEEAD